MREFSMYVLGGWVFFNIIGGIFVSIAGHEDCHTNNYLRIEIAAPGRIIGCHIVKGILWSLKPLK